ncbi:ABC transporter permease [Clostridium sp.]|uniref:ABC transporter permease n=1 Tax=Clostridium sp. TaxID=1506 RepID=UPI0032169B2C
MKFLSIVYYDILDLLRDKTSMLSMIIFPIILMTTLGITLSGAFSSSYEFKPKTVIYVNNLSTTSDYSEEKLILNNFLELGKKNNITFKEISSLEEGKKEVQTANSILLELKDKNIIVYKNSKNKYSTNIVISMLTSISKKVTLANITNGNIKTLEEGFTIATEFQPQKGFTSYDYYGIVEITMMMLYGSLYGFYSIYNNRRNKIEARCFQGNLSKNSYILTKVTSTFIVTVISLIPAMLYSLFILKAYWGEDFLSVIVLLFSLNFFGTTLGILFGYIFKEEKHGSFFLNTIIIPVMTFLGGGYVYLGDGNTLLDIVRYISPLTLINKSILSIAFYEDYSKFYISILYCVSLGILFLIFTFCISNKKEAY